MRKFLFILLLLAVGVMAVAQDLLQPEAWSGYYDIACTEKLVENTAEAFYMCRPSFSPEYALSIKYNRYTRQRELVLKRATENIWYIDNYYVKNGKRRKGDKWVKYHDVKVETFQLDLGQKYCTLIYDLVKAANESATYFNGERNGCDGVTYHFYSCNKYGRTWSPNAKCRTGRLVAVMDSICRAVQLGDTAMAYRQMPTCRTLLGEFRQDYPMAAFKPRIYGYKATDFGVRYVDDSEDTALVDYIYLYTDCLHIKRIFPKPVRMESANAWAGTLADRVALMSRQLFLSQKMPNLYLGVLFAEGQPEEYYYSEKGGIRRYLRLADTAGFEHRCLAAPLTEEGFYRLQADGTWQQADPAEAARWWDF